MAIKLMESLRMTSQQWPPLAAQGPRVAVIGAGVAGLVTARRLRAHGVDVTIFEARERVGGRAYTAPVVGTTLDLGAAWIHGRKGNPLAKLVKKLELETAEADYYTSALYDQDGLLEPHDCAFVLDRVWSLYDWIERLHHGHPRGAADVSVATAMAQDIIKQGGPPPDMVVVDYGMHLLSLDEGMELGKISLLAWEDDDPYEGEDLLMRRGYGALVERLAEGLTIRLGTPVQRVRWGQEGQPVELELSADQAPERFDCVVVTAPLGVLKAGALAFEPALPDWKQQSLDRLGMGLLNKVILRFEEVFWPAQAPMIAKLTEPHRWAGWMLNVAALTQEPILVGFVAGDQAREQEAKSDAEIVATMMEDLSQIFGPELPEPVDFYVTRWGQDPWSRGSYPHSPVGARGADFDTMAEPVGRWLYFAGDGTDEDNPSTVTGALCSGLREAERILRGWVWGMPEDEDDEGVTFEA